MALEAVDLSKSFPGAKALSGVGFDLRHGEVHALVGENGAGKSTLARILSGIYTADSGHILLDRQSYAPSSRSAGEKRGVTLVLQELNLIDNLSIAENIFLERLPNRGVIIDFPRLHSDARDILKRVGLTDLDPGTRVGDLGVGHKRLVEVGAGLSRKCRVLILDEPTAALTTSESQLLFEQIHRLRGEGVGIIYISHRLEEVRLIADRITVLRDGRRIWSGACQEVTIPEIIRLMVGREIGEAAPVLRTGTKVALNVSGLTRKPFFQEVSFQARRGEIMGFAGLAGSGRTETMRAIFGADSADSGDIFLFESETPARIRSPKDAVKLGVAMLPEERRSQGLLLPLSVRVNTTITHLAPVSRWRFWLKRAVERDVTEKLAGSMRLKRSTIEQRVLELSGGNQQKVVIAKWLHRDCDILICDEPTRGIDVRAKFEIYRLLTDLAGRGKAIIVVSSDLIELMAICDRIAVMSCGHLTAIYRRGEWTAEKIMAAALSKHTSSTRQPAKETR